MFCYIFYGLPGVSVEVARIVIPSTSDEILNNMDESEKTDMNVSGMFFHQPLVSCQV